MDLEMSGLDPEKDVILEIATIVTDANLNILAEGPVIAIHQSENVFESMDEWNTRHHNQSGLVDRCRRSQYSLKDAELETLRFIKPFTEKTKNLLCGNSITQDRRFLYKYMPEISEWLCYRNVDVPKRKAPRSLKRHPRKYCRTRLLQKDILQVTPWKDSPTHKECVTAPSRLPFLY